MQHWPNYASIGDFVQLQRGNTYQSKLLDKPGPYLLGLASIDRDGGFRYDKLRTYGGECSEKISVYPGDLYVSLKDVTQCGHLLGSIARVPHNIPKGRMTQDTVKLHFINNLIDKSYFYWALRTPEYRKYCKSRGTGTTNLSLSREDFLSFIIPKPSPTSTIITQTLEYIEDLTVLYRRTNQTLEAIAQAIFKSWFVDFDPVKAKIAALEQGEDPLRAAMRTISGKTDDELDQLPREQYDELAAAAELFPDAMEESELGEIPEGWKASPLDQVANYMNGLALQKFPAEDSSDYLPVIKIAQLKTGNTTGSGRASTNIRPEYVIKNGDVLFSWSGSLEVDVWTAGAGALNQHLFKVTSSTTPKWFYLYATKHHLPWFREIAATKATTMGHIQRKHLADALIAVPPNDLMKISSGIISPLLEKHIFLRTQEKDLHKIRDHLLPKLLSGYLVDTVERNTTT